MAIILDEQAAPSAVSNKGKLYVDTSNVLRFLDESSNNYQLSSSEGSWTPIFEGTTGAGTFTYGIQVGRYERQGNKVCIQATIQISAIPVAPTGNMQIAGLPVATRNVTNLLGGVSFGVISQFNYAASALQLLGRIRPNVSVIDLMESFDNGAVVQTPAANFTNTACLLAFAAVYFV